MNMKSVVATVAVIGTVGCATVKVQPEKFEQSQASIRSAEELGAYNVPAAKLHLQLAKEQTELAKKMSDSGLAAELAAFRLRESDMRKQTEEFSGGWLMRIALAKILLQSPDILLLDEPTNHLDLESVTWLEGFLRNYDGAILLVSHDRAFMDGLVDRVADHPRQGAAHQL